MYRISFCVGTMLSMIVDPVFAQAVQRDLPQVYPEYAEDFLGFGMSFRSIVHPEYEYLWEMANQNPEMITNRIQSQPRLLVQLENDPELRNQLKQKLEKYTNIRDALRSNSGFQRVMDMPELSGGYHSNDINKMNDMTRVEKDVGHNLEHVVENELPTHYETNELEHVATGSSPLKTLMEQFLDETFTKPIKEQLKYEIFMSHLLTAALEETDRQSQHDYEEMHKATPIAPSTVDYNDKSSSVDHRGQPSSVDHNEFPWQHTYSQMRYPQNLSPNVHAHNPTFHIHNTVNNHVNMHPGLVNGLRRMNLMPFPGEHAGMDSATICCSGVQKCPSNIACKPLSSTIYGDHQVTCLHASQILPEFSNRVLPQDRYQMAH